MFLCPVTLQTTQLSTPAFFSIIIAVEWRQWLVYCLDNPAVVESPEHVAQHISAQWRSHVPNGVVVRHFHQGTLKEAVDTWVKLGGHLLEGVHLPWLLDSSASFKLSAVYASTAVLGKEVTSNGNVCSSFPISVKNDVLFLQSHLDFTATKSTMQREIIPAIECQLYQVRRIQNIFKAHS